ncbi:MAG: hypothetical protein NXI10_08600 [bacterium]|nr:hypothetical protein [bacterium]
MKTILFNLFILFVSTAFAQEMEITGTVTTLDGSPVKGAIIIDQRGTTLDSTREDGTFRAEVITEERFGVDMAGFELAWTKAEKGKRKYDIVLDVEVQEFESIVITRRNSEEALDIKNVNIIHYQPLDGAILTLKKEKRTYYLGMDSLRREGVSYALDIDRPRELFFDCFRNAYVLNAETAYQFVIVDSGLVMLSEVPIEVFNQYIRPCVAKFDDRLVMEELKSLNKEYELVLYNKQEPRTIYHKRDELGYQAAFEASVAVGKMVDPNNGDTLVDPVYLRRQQRRDVYGRHDTAEEFKRARIDQREAEVSVEREATLTFNAPDSLTTMGQNQRGPQFGSQDAWKASKNWEQGMAAYMLFTQPVDVKTFQIGNFAAVVDFDSNVVQVFDHYGYSIKTSSFAVPSDVKNVLQDKATGYLYLYTRDKGNHKVYGLDAFTGNVSYLKNFGGMPHTEQAIIYDGYLYYKVLERDFYGINRVRLPKMEFFSEAD